MPDGSFSLVVAGLLGYLLGAVPVAFLLVKWKTKLDIRNAGSGNVGAYNSFEVTRSKLVGGAVLLLDVLKGVVAVVAAEALLGGGVRVAAVSGIAAVFGHNFPVWLRFKGGRGLATAAGAMVVLGWPFIVMWGAIWLAGYKLSGDINVGNAAASLVTPAAIMVLPWDVLSSWVSVETSGEEFRIFAAVLFIIILSRLVEPVMEYIKAKQSQNN